MRVCSAIAGCLTVAAISLVATTGAAAHQSPPGCTVGSLNAASINETAVMHRNGEVIEFEPGYANANPAACDVTDFSVSITFPNPDGSPGGRTVVAATDRTALGGSGTVRLPVVPYTVDFNDGVYSGPVKVTISGGTFHGATDTPYGEASSSATLYISRPKVSLSVTAAPTEVAAGQPVTYTYKAKNESTSFPGDMGFVNMSGSQVTDDRCAPVTYVSGDGGWADVLDVGETWTFTCTTTLDEVGTIVNHATYSGLSTRDSVPDPVTATAESTVVTHGADLVVDLNHEGNFTRGSAGSHSILVRNDGDLLTSSLEDIKVAGTLPPGLTATAISGEGWNCDLASLTCGRAFELAGGAALPPITLQSDVAENAPNSVTSTVTVSGGQEADPTNNTDSDVAIVDPAPPPGDTVAPRLTKLKVSPARVRTTRKRGSKISWNLSETASVKFGVEHRVNGEWRRVKGSFKANGKLGKNKVRFSGRVGGKKLKPGRHRLIAVATDRSGNSARPVRRAFRVIGR